MVVSVKTSVRVTIVLLPKSYVFLIDPLIVRRLVSLLSNEVVSDGWISQAIFNLKEEWMQ